MGSRQRQQARLPRTGRFRALARVVELVKADQVLVALAGYHLAHHAAGRQSHRRNARIERQHLRADFFKLRDSALALAYQRHQRVVGR